MRRFRGVGAVVILAVLAPAALIHDQVNVLGFLFLAGVVVGAGVLIVRGDSRVGLVVLACLLLFYGWLVLRPIFHGSLRQPVPGDSPPGGQARPTPRQHRLLELKVSRSGVRDAGPGQPEPNAPTRFLTAV